MHIAVIGAGLIGAAAARHLAKAGHKTTLIGPNEPASFAKHTGVFGSHYDEGRITRSLDPNPFWSRVGRRAIARYGEIAHEGANAFYTEAGCAIAGPKNSPIMAQMAQTVQAEKIACASYNDGEIATALPMLSFPSGTSLTIERQNAGHISPRRLVAAQIAAAKKFGATHLPQVATDITETAQGVRVAHAGGHVQADRVLVAAGAYSAALLGLSTPIDVMQRTVVLMQLSAAEADRLTGLPSLIWFDDQGIDCYMLPPIRYPDGNIYLKTGGDRVDVPLRGAQAINAWFQGGGDTAVAHMLLQATQAVLPGLRVESHRAAPCVTSYTQADYPMIGQLSPRISVATAGCGRAAKSSDELGRLGAITVLGQPLPDWAQVCVAP